MDDRQKAKEIYQSLVQKGHRPTLQEFADSTFRVLGTAYKRPTIKSWYAKDNWADISMTYDDEEPEIQDTRKILEMAHVLCMAYDDVKKFANYARAFYLTVTELPESLLLEYQSHIIDVRDEAKSILLGKADHTTFSSLTKTWASLKRYLIFEINDEEEGVDPDEILLGVIGGDGIYGFK